MLKETIIALTLYGEAGNQDYQSKLMVASVISQRARDSHKSLVQVCRTPKWFSCWNKGSIYLTKGISDKNGFDTQSWLDCVILAYNMPKAQGYTHYHAQHIVPYWARKAHARSAYVKHGTHLFYKKADLK